MIAHLAGRETALEPFGWTGRKAGWIALACLHSGVFIRTQWSRFLNAHPEHGVHALVASGVAAEETVPDIRGIGRVCRIFSRRLYRALHAEDIRHRRIASPTVLMCRLLSLDYVLEHPDLPLLPTEPEKIGAFETLGIERRLLPSRLYRGATGSTRRYFPLKLPVALDTDRTLFVYVDPGHETLTALGTWADAHNCVWEALAKRQRSVEVVAVVRTDKEFDRAQAVLQRWVRAAGPSEASADVREELARIERAILRGTLEVLEEFGGLQAALKRSRAREAGTLTARPAIDQPRQHLEIGAPLRSPFPMSGPRVMPLLECENDRFDSHFRTPAIHTAMTAQPPARGRLAGPRPDRRWPGGPLDRGRDKRPLWTPR